MRLFIKILLFVFVALITNVKVISAATTFIDIQKVTTSFSILDETPEIDFKVIENDLANCCQNGQDLVDYRNWVTSIEVVAAKTSTKLLNQFNSAENLIQGAGNLTKVKAGMQGFVKGDGASIFKAITNGGTLSPKGYYIMPNGTVISKYFSSTSGDFTIFINQGSNAFKIRITP